MRTCSHLQSPPPYSSCPPSHVPYGRLVAPTWFPGAPPLPLRGADKTALPLGLEAQATALAHKMKLRDSPKNTLAVAVRVVVFIVSAICGYWLMGRFLAARSTPPAAPPAAPPAGTLSTVPVGTSSASGGNSSPSPLILNPPKEVVSKPACSRAGGSSGGGSGGGSSGGGLSSRGSQSLPSLKNKKVSPQPPIGRKKAVVTFSPSTGNNEPARYHSTGPLILPGSAQNGSVSSQQQQLQSPAGRGRTMGPTVQPLPRSVTLPPPPLANLQRSNAPRSTPKPNPRGITTIHDLNMRDQITAGKPSLKPSSSTPKPPNSIPSTGGHRLSGDTPPKLSREQVAQLRMARIQTNA